MSKDLAQIMKNLKTENGEGPLLPKSGHVTATRLVKAARDYANLHQDLNVRQEISEHVYFKFFIQHFIWPLILENIKSQGHFLYVFTRELMVQGLKRCWKLFTLQPIKTRFLVMCLPWFLVASEWVRNTF